MTQIEVSHGEIGVSFCDHPARIASRMPSPGLARPGNHVPPHLLPAIKAHLRDHTEPESDALLFPAASGGHLAPSTFYGAAPTVVKGARGKVLEVRGGHGYDRARVLAGRRTRTSTTCGTRGPSWVPCTPGGRAGRDQLGFQFTFVSGVPCTGGALRRHQAIHDVSIHLREWGAVDRRVG